MQPVVELVQVSKIYHTNGSVVHAVRDANLSVPQGSFVALMGRSGCGKSTLLNLAGAVDLPTSGDVFLAQRPTRQLGDAELSRLRRTAVGFVFQFFHLLPTFTVEENVELPLLLDGRALSPPVRQTIRSLLEHVGLADKAQCYPHQLSGGEMQRAALARALVHEPQLVIADEPTGNLDSSNAEVVLTLLQQLARERNCAVLMATHSREAASYAARVIEMKDGRLLSS